MLTLTTTGAAALKSAFDAAIRSGAVRTWETDAAGDYKHIASAWAGKGWMCPVVTGSALTFTLLISTAVTDKKERRAVYAYYHAHMAETFSRDFPSYFSAATFTVSPGTGESAI